MAAAGRCYGLALELQNVPSKAANNFNILGLFLAIFHNFSGWGSAITFKVRLSFKNKYVELLREVWNVYI